MKNPIGWVDPLGLADVPMVGGGCGGKSESGSAGDATSQLSDGVEAPKVTRFRDGDLFEHSIETKQGPINLIAETIIEGKTLYLKDVSVYGEQGNKALTGLQKDIFRATKQIKEYAKEQGFVKLKISGNRLESSSSARPGHDVDLSWDL